MGLLVLIELEAFTVVVRREKLVSFLTQLLNLTENFILLQIMHQPIEQSSIFFWHATWKRFTTFIMQVGIVFQSYVNCTKAILPIQQTCMLYVNITKYCYKKPFISQEQTKVWRYVRTNMLYRSCRSRNHAAFSVMAFFFKKRLMMHEAASIIPNS